jgi:NAD(P)-dependent dehydrogenase (short-subunit alcohol dehydrogenase family)
MTRTALITGRRPESDARRRSGSRAAVSRRCRTGSVMSTSHFSMALRSDLHGTGVRVAVVEPGRTTTEIVTETDCLQMKADDIAEAMFAIRVRLRTTLTNVSDVPGNGVQIVLTHTFDREEGTGKPVCVAEAVVRSHEPAAPEDRSPGAAGSARWPTRHLPSSAITGSITAVEAQAACVPLGAVNAPFLIS